MRQPSSGGEGQYMVKRFHNQYVRADFKWADFKWTEIVWADIIISTSA